MKKCLLILLNTENYILAMHLKGARQTFTGERKTETLHSRIRLSAHNKQSEAIRVIFFFWFVCCVHFFILAIKRGVELSNNNNKSHIY